MFGELWRSNSAEQDLCSTVGWRLSPSDGTQDLLNPQIFDFICRVVNALHCSADSLIVQVFTDLNFTTHRLQCSITTYPKNNWMGKHFPPESDKESMMQNSFAWLNIVGKVEYYFWCFVAFLCYIYQKKTIFSDYCLKNNFTGNKFKEITEGYLKLE